jgi:hypothetical protein
MVVDTFDRLSGRSVVAVFEAILHATHNPERKVVFRYWGDCGFLSP